MVQFLLATRIAFVYGMLFISSGYNAKIESATWFEIS